MTSMPPRDPPPPSRSADPADFPTAPATGAIDPAFTELRPGEEPVATGTLFLTTILLMIIAGFWIIIYMRLLDR
jgi:hypothetical protein